MLPQSIIVTALVIAVVELIKRIRIKDWEAVATILSAAVVGGVAGYFQIEGLNVVFGILAGLSAAGIIKTAESVSGK